MSLTNADSRLTSRPEPDEQPDLALPSHFNNRELSLLEFNRRVLEQAKDQRSDDHPVFLQLDCHFVSFRNFLIEK